MNVNGQSNFKNYKKQYNGVLCVHRDDGYAVHTVCLVFLRFVRIFLLPGHHGVSRPFS